MVIIQKDYQYLLLMKLPVILLVILILDFINIEEYFLYVSATSYTVGRFSSLKVSTKEFPKSLKVSISLIFRCMIKLLFLVIVPKWTWGVSILQSIFLQYEESDVVLDNKVWGLDHIQKKIVFFEKIISSSRKKIDDNKKPNNKKVR